MYLWKYFAPARVHVLRDLKLRFTPAGSFNDPFEVVPHVAELLPLEEEEGYLKGLLAKNPSLFEEALCANLAANGVSLEDFDQLLRLVGISASAREVITPPDLPLRVTELAKLLTRGALNELRPTFGPSFQQRFGERFGILCLTANPTSLLMWAHYAQNHEGFVVGFDTRHPFFNPAVAKGGIGRLMPVIYSEQRPKITMYDPRMPTAEWGARLLQQLILTKSLDWSYEVETRFVLPLDDQLSYPHEVDSNGRHLFTIEPSAIAGVVIGTRTSADVKGEIVRIVGQSISRTLPVFQARTSDTEFQLLVEPVV